MYVSVIIPIYNTEKYLCRCIDSVLNQTFDDYEILLIDDGSTDNCGKICDEYALSEPRVRVIHQKHAGVSNARNQGIDIARGAIVGFVMKEMKGKCDPAEVNKLVMAELAKI